MKKFRHALLALVLIFTICATPAFARGRLGGPGPRFGGHHYAPAPRYYGGGRHHYHHSGPSRGWYNGALIVGATLAGLELISDIVAPPTTVVRETVYTQPAPQPVVVQQPVVQQPVVIQQPVVQQPAVQPVYVAPQAPAVYQPAPVLVTPVRTQTYWR